MTDATKTEGSGGWVIAANSSAGSAETSELAQAVLRLARHAPVQVRWTDAPDDVVAVAQELPDARLVVFGGDGTISSAADRLIEAGLGSRPVGLLPGGTGNDYVRAVGVPTDIDDAADALVGARPVVVSALRVAGRHGVNVCHAGLGAASARAASGWKDRLGAAAYPAGALLTGVRQPAWAATVTADGERFVAGDLLIVAMALGRTIGGGTDLSSEESLTSDAADLLVAEGSSALDRGRLGVALLREGAPHRDVAAHTRASRVRIESEQPMAVNLDGEDLGDHTDVTIEVVEQAWTILVPG